MPLGRAAGDDDAWMEGLVAGSLSTSEARFLQGHQRSSFSSLRYLRAVIKIHPEFVFGDDDDDIPFAEMLAMVQGGQGVEGLGYSSDSEGAGSEADSELALLSLYSGSEASSDSSLNGSSEASEDEAYGEGGSTGATSSSEGGSDRDEGMPDGNDSDGDESIPCKRRCLGVLPRAAR